MKFPEYLSAIHRLPCCICRKDGLPQTSPTQAHHTICGRYSGKKTPDRDAIPLCMDHHQGMRHDRDRSKLAIHQSKAAWVAAHGPDTDYIEATRDAVENLE